MIAAARAGGLSRRIRAAWQQLGDRLRPARGGRWQRGELALCTARRWQDADPADPVPGDILRVRDAEVEMLDGRRTVFLSFDGKPRTHSWEATGFRRPMLSDLAIARDRPAQRRVRPPLMPARQPETA